MAKQAHAIECIALAQLETALRLHRELQDPFSVVTLASAAEEILGKLVMARGGESALDSLKNAGAAIHEHLYGEPGDPARVAKRANRARNALKHWNAADGSTLTVDIHVEATDMLTRAIDNYWTLKTWLTPAMEAFERSQRAT